MEIARVKVVDWSGLTKEGSKNSQTSLRRDVLEKVPVGRHGSKFRREKHLFEGPLETAAFYLSVQLKASAISAI